MVILSQQCKHFNGGHIVSPGLVASPRDASPSLSQTNGIGPGSR